MESCCKSCGWPWSMLLRIGVARRRPVAEAQIKSRPVSRPRKIARRRARGSNQLFRNAWVGGSNPFRGISKIKDLAGKFAGLTYDLAVQVTPQVTFLNPRAGRCGAPNASPGRAEPEF